jgi:hypothetical protein
MKLYLAPFKSAQMSRHLQDHLGRRVPLKTGVLVTDAKVVVLLEPDQANSIVSTLAVFGGMVARQIVHC